MFTWLLFAERPLTLHEMAEAAVFRPGDNRLDPRDRLTHLSGVLSICRSLIILSDEFSGYPWSNYEGEIAQSVRFAHFSVKEYLTSGRSKIFTGLPVPSHEYLGNCCISMLLPIDHVRLPSEEMKDFWKDQYLLCYAAGSWFVHIKHLEALGRLPGELSSGVCKLLDRGPGIENYHAWMSIHDPLTDFLTPKHSQVMELRTSLFSPLFCACCLGLVSETHRYIKAGSDINEFVPGHGTALHVASSRHNHVITEILLQCGANAEIRDKQGRTAFGIAARYGHKENRRLLFDHGIDADDELEDALRPRNLEIACFLLEHGANGNRALDRAIRRRNFDMVQLIVAKSADLNAESYAGAFLGAAESGRLDIFELLLERGASIPATGMHSLHLLLTAVHGRSLGIVSRLVKSGINTNAPGSYVLIEPWSRPRTVYTTALQFAAYTNNHDMIKHLLENGAEVNRPGFSLGTELQAAIRPHLDAFRRFRLHPVESTLGLLIERGADVNQHVQTRSLEVPSTPPSRKKGTALQQAAAEGLDSAARFLVKEGADINAQHGHCGTALMCASRHSEPRTLQVLVDMKADINARVAGLGSALSEAAKWGQCGNVQFLLENGADFDAEVEGIGTALFTALLHGQFGTAAVLIEVGADFHAAIQDVSSAFSIASENECKEIIKLCFAGYHPYPKASDDRGLQDKRVQRESSGRRKTFQSCI